MPIQRRTFFAPSTAWATSSPPARRRNSDCSPDERSEIRDHLAPHFASLMRAYKRKAAMIQLSEEQRLMKETCRQYVDDVVIPFIRHNWQREWLMTPEDRLPPEILAGADKIGIRTLAVPEEFGGVEVDRSSEVQTFAIIAEEIARGDSGLSDKLVQNWKVSVLLRPLAPRHLQENWV